MSIRLFGAGIVLTSAMTLSGNNTLFQGATTYSANWSTTIAAGVYDYFSFCAKVNSQIRQALITNKHASLTAPALANVRFKMVFPTAWSSTPNANKLIITFDPTGFVVTAGSLQTTISSFTIDNLTGSKWLSRLGMLVESATSSASIVTYTGAPPNATLATFTGTHQSRSIFCFENSVRDTWDSEVRPNEATLQMRNGAVRRWSQGGVETYREITLVDLLADITGYPLDVATFSSFGATRLNVNTQAPDINQFTNVTDIANNLTVAVGDCVRIGNDDFWARVQGVSAGASITLLEFYPTTIVPTAGDVIWQISEAHALWIEAMRTNYFFVYEPDESSVAGSKYKAGAYKLNLNGRAEQNFSRLDQFLNLFSVVFPLTRANTPEVVVI